MGQRWKLLVNYLYSATQSPKLAIECTKVLAECVCRS